MRCSTLRWLIHFYLDGELGSDAAARIEAHLSSCSECREFVNQLKQDFARLREAREGRPPRPSLPRRILAALHRERDHSMAAARRWRQRLPALAVGALGLVVAGLFGYSATLTRSVEPQELSLFLPEVLYSGALGGIRARLTGAANGRGLPDRPVEIALYEEGGLRPIWKRRGETDASGCFSIAFPAPALQDGRVVLAARAPTRAGSSQLAVILPVSRRLRLRLITDQVRYASGDTLHAVAIVLNYPDLSPAGGAEVGFTVRDPQGRLLTEAAKKASSHGMAIFDLPLSPRLPAGAYMVEVRSAKMHDRVLFSVAQPAPDAAIAPLPAERAPAPPMIRMVPWGGKLVSGCALPMLISTVSPEGKPLRCRVTVRPRGSQPFSLETDENGWGYFYPEIPENPLHVQVEAGDGHGRPARQEAVFPVYPPGQIVVGLNRTRYGTGDVQIAAAIMSGRDRWVGVDFLSGGHVILTRTLRLIRGMAWLEEGVREEMAGTLVVRAYPLDDRDGHWAGAAAALIDLPQDLHLYLRPESPSAEGWPPRMALSAYDSSGRRVDAAVHVMAVRIPAAGENTPEPGASRDTIPIPSPPFSNSPTQILEGWPASPDALPGGLLRENLALLDPAAPPVVSAVDPASHFVRRAEQHTRALASTGWVALLGWSVLILASLGMSLVSRPRALASRVAFLVPGQFLRRSRSLRLGALVLFGSVALAASWQVAHLSSERAATIEASLAPVFTPGAAPYSSAKPPVIEEARRVEGLSPEGSGTAVGLPTSSSGPQALWGIPLGTAFAATLHADPRDPAQLVLPADLALGEVRIFAIGITEDGKWGEASWLLRSRHPADVVLAAPPVLDMGHPVTVEALVRNPGRDPLRLDLALLRSPQMDVLEPSAQALRLPPFGEGRKQFAILPRRSGPIPLRLQVQSATTTWTVERETLISPSQGETISGPWGGRAIQKVLMVPISDASPEVRLTLFPGNPSAPAEAVLEGQSGTDVVRAAATIRASVQTLNVLGSNRTAKSRDRDELAERARRRVAVAYQDLLSLEHPEGGFCAKRGSPPDPTTTAVALLGLAGAEGAWEVDAQVVARARAALTRWQEEDGSWRRPLSGDLRPGGPFREPVGQTALVLWALAESKSLGESGGRALRFLAKAAPSSASPLARALALVASDSVRRHGGSAELDLRKLANGLSVRPGGSEELLGVAIRALALRQAGSPSAKEWIGLLWERLAAGGLWSDPWVDLFGLQALVGSPQRTGEGHASLSGSPADMPVVQVRVNGRALRVELDPLGALPTRLDLSTYLQPGWNRIELASEGRPPVAYRLWMRGARF